MSGAIHRYRTRLEWDGSTGLGYDHYDRDHRLCAVTDAGPVASAASGSLLVSADPTFLGDAARLNPEQLLVAAASSCHLLSFLAVASRRRLDVIGYTDDADGEMPEDDPPMRLTLVTLRPHVRLRSADADALAELDRVHEKAHHLCFIANSLTTTIVVEATAEVVP